MDMEIALILGQDGITNGAVYALLALALVLVFAVTRVIFIPQGEFVAYGALTLAMLHRPFAESTSTFFLEHALTGGGGTNVVNGMMVDFRGFDTMGEIVVLGIVALTVYALLRRFRPAVETMDLPEQQRYLPAKVRHFIDYLKAIYNRDGYWEG